MRVTLFVPLLLSCGCSLLLPQRPPHQSCAAAMAAVAQRLATSYPDTSRTIAFLGFREADGKQTPASRALDGLLVSSLVRERVAIGTGVGIMARDGDDEGPAWEPDALLPSDWQDLSSPLLLSGKVRFHEPWAYVRAVLIERRSGAVLHADACRVVADDLRGRGQQWAARRHRRGAGGEGAALPEELELAMDLHLVVRRDEGGFSRAVELVDGGSLRQGDRLQIRFRPRVDCTVYAFIFSSEGERQEVHASRLVYESRWQYGPSEQRWISVGEADEVYTLYLMAAPRLDDLGEMAEDMADLVEQGQVERFRGVDALDAAVSTYLDAHTEGSSPIVVQRGTEGIEEGDVESLTYEDGTVLESRVQVVTARRGLVRAVSYEVSPD